PQRRDEVGQQQAAEDHPAGEGEDGAAVVRGSSPWGREARQRARSMPSCLSTFLSYTGSVWPDFIFIRKYFSNATLARCTHLPARLQVTLRGGICGSATKAMPVSPMSARQMAFQVACAVAGSPASSARMFCAMAVTIDSIMNPVLGAPVGTGVASTGGIATHTPRACTLG